MSSTRKPLFGDLIAAHPGLSDELKAMTTMRDEIKLPPLPSPGIHPDEALDMGLESIPYFTADQVRQAQRDAVAQLAIASDARIAELERRCEILFHEREAARASYENCVKMLTGIHSLLYPAPIKLEDGRTMVFRPKDPDPHEILQELSDRIRALPDALKGQP